MESIIMDGPRRNCCEEVRFFGSDDEDGLSSAAADKRGQKGDGAGFGQPARVRRAIPIFIKT
jgi:hypothetical protein